jgi:hypothetical protein
LCGGKAVARQRRSEQVAEVEADELRYVLRKTDGGAARVHQRLEDKQAMLLAGCYAIVTDVAKPAMAAQAVHDNYMKWNGIFAL